MNTIRSLSKKLRYYGFRLFVYGYDAEPVYLQFNAFAYRMGVIIHALAPQSFKVIVCLCDKARLTD